MNTLDSALLQTLELLTPDEQGALLAVAQYPRHRRAGGAEPAAAAALLAELPTGEPRFSRAARDKLINLPDTLARLKSTNFRYRQAMLDDLIAEFPDRD